MNLCPWKTGTRLSITLFFYRRQQLLLPESRIYIREEEEEAAAAAAAAFRSCCLPGLACWQLADWAKPRAKLSSSISYAAAAAAASSPPHTHDGGFLKRSTAPPNAVRRGGGKKAELENGEREVAGGGGGGEVFFFARPLRPLPNERTESDWRKKKERCRSFSQNPNRTKTEVSEVKLASCCLKLASTHDSEEGRKKEKRSCWKGRKNKSFRKKQKIRKTEREKLEKSFIFF